MQAIPRGSALKLARAEHHIETLNRLSQAYFAQEPMKLVARFDPDSGNYSVAAKTDIPIPDEIALVAGDAAHNLRSALDMAYFAIISRSTSREDNIQFPIYRLDNKENVLSRRLIKLAPEKVRGAIEDSEPYPGGKYRLHELDTLDIRDKHRLLLVAGRTVPIPVPLVKLIMPASAVQFVGPGASLHFTGKGDELFTMELPFGHPQYSSRPYEKEIKFRPSFALNFLEGPFEGQALIPTLVNLRDNVRTVVAAIWAASGYAD